MKVHAEDRGGPGATVANANSHRTPRGRKALALLQAGALVFLGAIPAAALVVKACPTPQEDLEQADKAARAGAKLTFMVGLVTELPGGGGWNTASGVYLGASADKGTGYVLTCAHAFTGEDGEKPVAMKRIELAFGPTTTPDEETIFVIGSRVLLHPDFGVRAASTWKENKVLATPKILLNDVAIVEFSGAGVVERLEAHGRTAATLYEGTGYLGKPHLEAQIAGYGMFGTQTSTVLANPHGEVYAGNTRVTYMTFGGETGFFHFGLQAGKPLPPGPKVNFSMFKTLEGVVTYRNPYELTEVRVSTHANQAMISPGDSGGPLLFQTKSGLAVAGLAARVRRAPLINLATGNVEVGIVEHFEPLMDKLTWIRNVKLGVPGTTGILVPEDVSPEPIGESKEEFKQKPAA
jgi:hypothetical protein